MHCSRACGGARCPNLHERLDRAVLRDGDGEAEGLEGGLRDPRRDHGAARVRLPRGRHHVESAAELAEREGDLFRHRLELGDRVLLADALREVRARLLILLVALHAPPHPSLAQAS